MPYWNTISRAKVFYVKPKRRKKKQKALVQVEQVPKDKVKRFYEGFEWRRLRYSILKKYGFRCLACGRSPEDGAVIHVDHIKPLRKNWDLRLDPDNLQPLCDWCNHGKGNWDESDLRPPKC